MGQEPNHPPSGSPEKTPEPTIEGTESIGKNMMIIAWLIAIALATFIFGGIEDRQNNPNQSPKSLTASGQTIVELRQNRYGHYLTNGKINGSDVVFLLDTGATSVAIPSTVASDLGLKKGYSFNVNTANGTAIAYSTRLNSLEIGGILLNDLPASINPTMEGSEILLGMAALKQLEFQQKGNVLKLIQ